MWSADAAQAVLGDVFPPDRLRPTCPGWAQAVRSAAHRGTVTRRGLTHLAALPGRQEPGSPWVGDSPGTGTPGCGALLLAWVLRHWADGSRPRLLWFPTCSLLRHGFVPSPVHSGAGRADLVAFLDCRTWPRLRASAFRAVSPDTGNANQLSGPSAPGAWRMHCDVLSGSTPYWLVPVSLHLTRQVTPG